MNSKEQSSIVSKLKEHFSEGRSPIEVNDLLLGMKERPDLLARVEDEIDTMLVTVQKTLSGQPQKPKDGLLPNTRAGSVKITELEMGEPKPAANADEPLSGKVIAGLVVLVFFVICILTQSAIGFLLVIRVLIGVVVGVVALISKIAQMK